MTTSKSRFKLLNFLPWFLFLIVGFFIGSSMNFKDSTSSTTEPGKHEIDELNLETSETEESEDTDLKPYELETIKIFEDAAPSVAFITTTSLRRDFFTRNVMEIPKGTGSGFVWDNNGNIVTNFHVIQGADKAQVTLADQTSYEAELVGVAPEKDLAVLRIDAPIEKLSPISVGKSDNLLVGQSVYAIGNPFGLDQTLTTGIISALGREINSVANIPIRDVIQTDAAINPGNSGGPLLNSSGELIGVNTAIYSPSGASAGVGFSIPVKVVKWVVPELIEFGEVRRAQLGIELASERIMRQLRLEGVLVIHVVKNGAADKAGIRPTLRDRTGQILLGDIITGLNEAKIRSETDLFLELEKYQPGDIVTVKFTRDDELYEVDVVLDGKK